ncbi:MAG: glycosyltransferase [Bacteroidales bacterium]|nr:glycosyltransferase [Bacteroidales bacterium]
MKLSVVVVNYNVKYFLTQCLLSVDKARKTYEKKYGQNLIEVFVVDNNSKDNSCAYIKENFPEVILIENKKNDGFSSANNQAIRQSKAEYVLLLNPDTIIPEDTFIKTLDFADKNQDAGGIGVKMNNGEGVFLPESKRAFPSPSVSFYKIFGLSKLFPKSKRFGKYHLTYLDDNEINKIEVLPGAFMLLRKTALDKAGLLDETFFMYGEDIDLSYRIAESGFANYYYPEVNIIHYKGESTKKGSLNYVFMFYNAMIIFAKKHFSGKNAFLFSFLIKSAIIFRAGLSIIKRIFKVAFLPFTDVVIFYSGFYFLKPLWENYKFHHINHYPPEYMYYAVPSYIAVWILSIMLAKGYRNPIDSKRLFKGILSGALIILIIYSLLNETYRYSRLLLLAGTAWAMVFSWLIRAIFTVFKFKRFSFRSKKEMKILFFSSEPEERKIEKNLLPYFENHYYSSRVEKKELIAGKIKDEQISHLVLAVNNLTFKEVISLIVDKKNYNTEIQIAYPNQGFIIGSHKVMVSSETDITEHFVLNEKAVKLQKRLFDIIFSCGLILFFPILILVTDEKRNYFKNIVNVLKGKNTWVGYIESEKNNLLPKLKPGILNPVNYPVFDSDEIIKINFRYARDYHLTDDIYTIYKTFNKIGNKKL